MKMAGYILQPQLGLQVFVHVIDDAVQQFVALMVHRHDVAVLGHPSE